MISHVHMLCTQVFVHLLFMGKRFQPVPSAPYHVGIEMY